MADELFGGEGGSTGGGGEEGGTEADADSDTDLGDGPTSGPEAGCDMVWVRARLGGRGGASVSDSDADGRAGCW